MTPGNEQATLAVVVADHLPMPEQATEDEMLAWLWRHFRQQSWAAVPQVTVSMNDLSASNARAAIEDSDRFDASGTDRRIDMLMARRARNPEKYGPLETLAIEVKVTRADFASDVRNPAKQAPWRSAASRHAYAVPAGLVQPDETPAGSGMLWVWPPAYKGGMARVEWVKRPPSIPGHKPALPFRVLMALFWRTSTNDAVTRGWCEPTPGERTAEDLRAELVAARKDRDRLERELRKAREAATSWKKAYSLSGGEVPCACCGKALKPLRPKAGDFNSWRHLDPADLDPCEAAQRRAAEQKARDDYDAASDADRDRQLRFAHRYGFNPATDESPWLAFMLHDWTPTIEPAGDVPTSTVDTASA